MKKYLYSIGQQVVIPANRFPSGHKPTKGDIYTISGRRTEEFDPDDFFNAPGNYYALKEVPSGEFRESDITHIIEPQPTTMKTTKTYLVDINLVISVEIPPNIDPDSEDAFPFIQAAIDKRLFVEPIQDWLMENIGDITLDEEEKDENPTNTDPEAAAYEEGRQAWAAFEANNGKRAKGNPYEIGTTNNAAWNRGFNVG